MENFAPIIGLIVIILLIVIIVKIKKAIRHKHSTCPNCKKEYSYPEDFEIIASPLKWRVEKKEEKKVDFTYEIEYKVFYRIVTFNFKCSKCGHAHWYNKSFDVYRSDSKYSQSDAEELMVLKNQIRSQFDKNMFDDKEIEVYLAED